MAWQIFDAKGTGFLDQAYGTAPGVKANSIEELAEELRTPGLTKTIDEFNAAVQEEIPLDYTIRDGRGTVGITPPKSNWPRS